MHKRKRTKTSKARNHFFFGLFHLSFLTISPLSTWGPCPKPLYGNWCDTGTCSTSSSDCELGLQTRHSAAAHQPDTEAASWQRKGVANRLCPSWSRRLLGASAIAQTIAGMKGCNSWWHNTPQASICAGEDITSASPVVSTRIYNVYQGSANIILPVIHPLLKYGLQNQFTCCSCLRLSSQAFELSVKEMWCV